MHLTGSTGLFHWLLAPRDHLSMSTLVNLRSEIATSLHCLGPVNAGIFYAITFCLLPTNSKWGSGLQVALSYLSQNWQILADDSSWSYGLRAPDGLYTHLTAAGGRELTHFLSWIKLIIWFVNALFRNIKFNIDPPPPPAKEYYLYNTLLVKILTNSIMLTLNLVVWKINSKNRLQLYKKKNRPKY